MSKNVVVGIFVIGCDKVIEDNALADAVEETQGFNMFIDDVLNKITKYCDKDDDAQCYYVTKYKANMLLSGGNSKFYDDHKESARSKLKYYYDHVDEDFLKAFMTTEVVLYQTTETFCEKSSNSGYTITIQVPNYVVKSLEREYRQFNSRNRIIDKNPFIHSVYTSACRYLDSNGNFDGDVIATVMWDEL